MPTLINVLICCERKILLVGWWLVAGADLVLEKNTTASRTERMLVKNVI